MRMRGAIPTPRHILARATPHRALPFPVGPAFGGPALLDMWGNDVWGDCVTAEEAAAKACWSCRPGVSATELFLPSKLVTDWAWQHGYLNGANLTDVMDSLAKSGFSYNGTIYTDGPYTSVDYTDDQALCSAIYQGPVKIGVAARQLEGVVGSSNGWVAWDFSHDGNEDHCTGLWDYGTLGALCVKFGVTVPVGANGNEPSYEFYTWRTRGIMTRSSLLNICGEAWLRTWTTPQQPGPVVPPTPTPTPTPVPTPSPTPTPVPGPMILQPGVYTGNGVFTITIPAGPAPATMHRNFTI